MNAETEELIHLAIDAIEDLYQDLTEKECNRNRDTAFNLLTWREGVLDRLCAARHYDK